MQYNSCVRQAEARGAWETSAWLENAADQSPLGITETIDEPALVIMPAVWPLRELQGSHRPSAHGKSSRSNSCRIRLAMSRPPSMDIWLSSKNKALLPLTT